MTYKVQILPLVIYYNEFINPYALLIDIGLYKRVKCGINCIAVEWLPNNQSIRGYNTMSQEGGY